MNSPPRNKINIDSHVWIETKQNQNTGRLTKGIVKEILTSSEFHPHGIKVRLEYGQVGRVKKIEVDKKIKSSNTSFADLEK